LTAGLLLDTCAVIWIVHNDPMAEKATLALNEAKNNCEINFVSPITAWEIGILASRGRLAIAASPYLWFNNVLHNPEIRLSEMSPDILIESSHLPGNPPNDPADRIIIATARSLNLTIVTRDQKILDYADGGHVKSLKC